LKLSGPLSTLRPYLVFGVPVRGVPRRRVRWRSGSKAQTSPGVPVVRALTPPAATTTSTWGHNAEIDPTNCSISRPAMRPVDPRLHDGSIADWCRHQGSAHPGPRVSLRLPLLGHRRRRRRLHAIPSSEPSGLMRYPQCDRWRRRHGVARRASRIDRSQGPSVVRCRATSHDGMVRHGSALTGALVPVWGNSKAAPAVYRDAADCRWINSKVTVRRPRPRCQPVCTGGDARTPRQLPIWSQAEPPGSRPGTLRARSVS
jgi:hypothetical protein